MEGRGRKEGPAGEGRGREKTGETGGLSHFALQTDSAFVFVAERILWLGLLSTVITGL